MLIGQSERRGEEDDSDVEDDLYNLMRGHTSMMITANAGDSDDSDGSHDSDGESVEDHQGEEEEDDSEEESVVEDKGESEDKVLSSSVVPAEQSSSVEPDCGRANGPLVPDPNFAPMPWRRFEWGNALDRQGPEPEPTSWGRSCPKCSPSPSSSRSSSPDQQVSRSRSFKQQSSGEDDDEESGSEENDAEESSSEGEDEGEPPRGKEDSDDSDRDEGTIGQIFKEIRNGTYNSKKRRKRFEGQRRNERKFSTSSSYLEGEDGWDEATRGDCVMNTTEALYRLTRNDKKTFDEDDEWIIIKVPRKGKKWFYVDYCDGDNEDEFHWLEGPYLQKYFTVEDLLDKRRNQPRTVRRRRGEAQFRDDEELDKCDPDGNLLSTFYECCKRQRPRVFRSGEKHSAPSQPALCYRCHHEVFSDLSDESLTKSELDTSLKAGTPPKAFKRSSNLKQDKRKANKSKTALMTKQEKHIVEEAPLHDLSCVGIDTCSARSISCNREDFIDLEIKPRTERQDHLQGVGGHSGIAGKGCLVFYVQDREGNLIVLIEPRGFYLEKPTAKFRILGQQRMKKKGVCVIQDYDDAGTDILKCKRSGTVLPLTEEDGLLLLQTISFKPEDELQQQIRRYVQELKLNDNFLPHVVDLQEFRKESGTVLIMNEASLKR